MAYTQNEKPSGLDTLTSLATDDVFIVGDTSDSSRAKAITKANLLTDLNSSLSIDDGNVSAAASATNYTPASATVEGHLSGIDTALASAGSQLTQEEVEDFAGNMIATGGTKTGITVTYQDGTNDMDFVTEVTLTGAETLTNKTINGDNNIISNLDLGNEVDWAAIGDISDRTAFASGDKILIYEAGVGMRKVDYDDLPGAGGGMTNFSLAGDAGTPQTISDGNTLTVAGGTGLSTTASATDTVTINADTASDTQAGVVELATIAETNTGTDTTRAVTPDGLDGWTGSAQIVTTGTVTTGTWGADLSADTVDAITEIASGIKSGSDATLVTGTAGTSGNLSQWDANGDLIDAGFSVNTGTPGKGSILVGDGVSEYDEVTVGTNDQIIVADSAQTNGVKYVDLDSAINFIIDGGGSAITTGIKGDVQVPFDCTIEEVTLLADQTGSITVDIWKDTYANFPATDADSITASAVPAISSGTKDQDSTLTGWTTSVTAGEHLRFNVDSAATIERCTVVLKVRRNF